MQNNVPVQPQEVVYHEGKADLADQAEQILADIG